MLFVANVFPVAGVVMTIFISSSVKRSQVVALLVSLSLLLSTSANASQVSSKAPKNPGAKAKQIAKIVSCPMGLILQSEASDEDYYVYGCYETDPYPYHSSYTDKFINIFNYSASEQKSFKKALLNEYCFSSSEFTLITDFTNYDFSAGYMDDAQVKAMLKKLKKKYKKSVAYSYKPTSGCKRIK